MQVNQKDNGMVELRRENGDTLVIEEDVYELARNLLELLKDTDPKIIRAAVQRISPKEIDTDIISKAIYAHGSKYLELYHPEFAL